MLLAKSLIVIFRKLESFPSINEIPYPKKIKNSSALFGLHETCMVAFYLERTYSLLGNCTHCFKQILSSFAILRLEVLDCHLMPCIYCFCSMSLVVIKGSLLVFSV
jgi:hypothetical protein